MNNLHQKLTQKYQIYHNWHQTKHHNKIHWGVLVVFTLVIFSLIINPFGFDTNNKLNTSSTQAQTTLEIPLTVEEPAGIPRTNEPVTSGIPLPQGTIVNTQEWSLWDGATELPLQVTKLPGRTPWILLDFPVSLNANEKKTLTLKQIPSTTSSNSPLSITEDTNQITVSNKIIKTTINKTNFNLFEEVWLDKNNNQSFDQGEEIITPQPDNIQIIDSTTNQTFSGKGTPTKITWEYQGPLRSTLRVEGRYTNGATEFIAYTTWLTFYAGKSDIKIEHILRNSYQPNERHVKVKSATIKIGPGTTQLRANKSNSLYWSNVGIGGVALGVLPTTMGISGYVGDFDVDQNGGWVLPDLTYEGRTFVVDFSEGLSSTEQTRRANVVRSPLFVMASPSWYSEYGELSTSKFSTLEDEKQAYQKWGWTWNPEQEPKDSHKPDYLVWWWPSVHDDSEADDVWQNLLMYLRTSSRGYLDRAMGWAWYQKYRYPRRTDGFDYNWKIGAAQGPGSTAVDRPLISIPLTSTDQTYLNNEASPGRAHNDHMYGWGLIDYHYLTGDKGALEAAIDLGEMSYLDFAWRKIEPDNYNITSYGLRDEGRNLLLASRLWEATQDPKWRSHMDHIAQLLIDDDGSGVVDDWDARGAYLGKRDHPDKPKTLSPFENGLLAHGMYRYFQLTGNTIIRDKLIKMAEFGMNYALHPAYDFTGYFIAMDYPNPGDFWHQNFDSVPLGLNGFDPLYTTTWIDLFVSAYRITGNQAFLDRAKHHWDRASKARYGDPLTRTAGDNQVGRFVNASFGSGGVYYSSNGDLSYNHLLFYDYARVGVVLDTTSPTNPSNLTAIAVSSSQINLSWAASTDTGGSGLTGYKIYRCAVSACAPTVQIATSSTNSYLNTGLTASTAYTYAVSAYDAAGNEGGKSIQTSATTQVPSTNPIDNLSDNSWIYLNPQLSKRYKAIYQNPSTTENQTLADMIETRGPAFREFSGIIYGDGKIFYFGGGHTGYAGNDVEIYDIVNNVWTQSYKPEVPPADDPVYGSGGTGNISPTGRPYTRHTYSSASYDPILKRYLLTAAYDNLASYDPQTNQWNWIAGRLAPGGQPPYPDMGYGHLTQWDSSLGGILGIGRGGIWLWKDGVWASYDNVNVLLDGVGGSASVYIPDIQSHLFAVMPQGNCCEGYLQGHLYLYHSISKTVTEITSVPNSLKNQFNPEGNFVMAYDSTNKKVIALSAEDKSLSGASKVQVWVYDPMTDNWDQLPISASSPFRHGFSAMNREPLQYDSIHNAFILVDKIGEKVQTWAYRYKKASSVPDTQAPTNPTNLSATAISPSQINLTWTASTDDVGVTGYKIYRCAGLACAPTVQIATSATNSYSNTGLTSSTAYTYTVSAFDVAGNESGKSGAVSVTTLSQFKQTDFNKDRLVNQLDFDILKQDWNRADKPVSDLNQDGIVDSRDLGIMMSEWTR